MKNLLILTTFFLFFSSVASAQILDKVLKSVEKTNKILDEADKMLGIDNSSSSSSRGRKGSGFQIVSPNPDIEIQVTRCIASGSSVIIDFTLTNYASDASIEFDRGSIAFDDMGNQYANFNAAGGGAPEWTKKTLYPTDIPVKCRMWIDNVKENATSFKRINLVTYCPALEMTYKNPIMFYNMPISRKDNSATISPEEETTSSQSSENTLESTKEIDEDFDVFEDKFIGNSRFQTARIKFDNLGYNADGEKWTRENWNILKNKPSSMENSEQYKYDQTLSDKQCVQKIWIPDSDFLLEYTYSKMNGKWYLIKVIERF